jgi:hypothetical protein
MTRESRKPILLCKICRGFGFTGKVPPAEGVAGAERGWFAEDVFEIGVPCSCEAGKWFAEIQKEWMKPMPEGRERD